MIEAFAGIVPHLKAVHVTGLVLWCAGLFALPLMLARHDSSISQQDYARVRNATHYGFTVLVTPAAVIAIASGTLLVFLRDVFVIWMFFKLVLVALLVTFHAWIGHTLVNIVESEGTHEPPSPFMPAVLLLVTVVAILTLVLVKPPLAGIVLPDWLMEPHSLQWPFDVPR